MQFARRLVLLLAGSLALAPHGHAQNSGATLQTEEKIEILVNDTPISGYDISQRVRLMSVTTRQQPTPAMRKKAVEDLISESIQIQEARKFGIIVGPDEVEQALASIAKRNNVTKEKLVQALTGLGVDIRTMKRRYEAQMAWQRVVRGKFRSQISVGATQVDKALSNKKPEEGEEENLVEKTEFQLRRVRLELPESPEQKEIAERLIEADQIRQRVTSCDQIESAIKRYSDTTVKDLGRKKAENYTHPSRALLMAAKPGQLTPAYITSTGVELFAVCSKRTVRANDTQRRKVQAELIGQEYEILATRYLRDLRQEAYIEYR